MKVKFIAALLAGGIAFYPMVLEGTTSPCSSLVSKMTTQIGVGDNNAVIRAAAVAVFEKYLPSKVQHDIPSPLGPQPTCWAFYWLATARPDILAGLKVPQR
jgi:hypothetical protein